MNLLDIGCGTGMFTIELAKYVAQIDAIDCSSEMLKFANNYMCYYLIHNGK